MFTRIYISEIQTDLQYTDRRSVLKWCRNMEVKIFTDKGCKRQYAIKDEYESIKNHQILEYLKQKYGTENPFEANTKKISTTSKPTDQNQSQYIPQYQNEKRLLSIFTNL